VAIPRRRAQDRDDESAAPLHFEFEDEGADPDFDSPAEDERVAAGSGAAAALGLARRWWPRPPGWWLRWPLRRRIAVAGAAAAVLASALTVNAFVIQADRRAHDRVTVIAVNGAYVPSADGEGLDLVLSLRDEGPATATLYWVGVDQPGLALGYLPLPLPMRVGHPIAVRLEGRYSCTGDAQAIARTLTAVVQSPRGVRSDLTVALPRDAALPDGWQSAREAFCLGMAMATVPKLP
jgi:hypothetical protein